MDYTRNSNAKKLTTEQVNILNQVFDRAREFEVLDMIEYIWHEASKFYSSPRVHKNLSVSFWDKDLTQLGKNGQPIYVAAFYMGCESHNENLEIDSNYIYVSLSPKSLARLSRRTKQDCWVFLGKQTGILNSPLCQWTSLPDWRFLPITRMEQASTFLNELKEFVGV
ncbi:hypothetical protein [Nostoc sp. 106C]|uniref:hypothetical protein n=1 Tax=Nostoc sp. 106C TaxID=1932667 RepID=UPI000A3B6D52|nr:hypothetical protein [Nostoc sp. 106C]OUL20448.1 hypothetical protein BV375_30815 [Nostoc sp. 106C]